MAEYLLWVWIFYAKFPGGKWENDWYVGLGHKNMNDKDLHFGIINIQMIIKANGTVKVILEKYV